MLLTATSGRPVPQPGHHEQAVRAPPTTAGYASQRQAMIRPGWGRRCDTWSGARHRHRARRSRCNRLLHGPQLDRGELLRRRLRAMLGRHLYQSFSGLRSAWARDMQIHPHDPVVKRAQSKEFSPIRARAGDARWRLLLRHVRWIPRIVAQLLNLHGAPSACDPANYPSNAGPRHDAQHHPWPECLQALLGPRAGRGQRSPRDPGLA